MIEKPAARIEVESPQRGTSEDLELIAWPEAQGAAQKLLPPNIVITPTAV
jgi:hypothetical protein